MELEQFCCQVAVVLYPKGWHMITWFMVLSSALRFRLDSWHMPYANVSLPDLMRHGLEAQLAGDYIRRAGSKVLEGSSSRGCKE